MERKDTNTQSANTHLALEPSGQGWSVYASGLVKTNAPGQEPD